MSTSAGNGHLRVTGIDHVELGVPDLVAAVAFYRDLWGLRVVVDDAGDGRVGLATTGAARPDLWLRRQPVADLGAIGLAVTDGDELDRIVAAVGRTNTTAVEVDADGRRATFTDPDRNRVVLVVEDLPQVGPSPSSDGRVRPFKVGHIVLHTADVASLEGFYALLGFRVTDRTAAGMSFLRCNADHHTLAFFSSGDGGLQHLAFDVATTDGVMTAMGQLRAEGVRPIWGPGRHGPGDNVFTYYEDPAGHIIEYFGDLETFEPDDLPGEPRFWGPEHRGDRWGLAGPPPEQFRHGRRSGPAPTGGAA